MMRLLWTVPMLLLAFASPAASVRDDVGRTVTLPRPAQRIVTLAPHATELVLAAGAGARLVAVSSASVLPAAFDHLPRIGGPGALDREALLALRPDLVIAWQSGNRSTDLEWIDRHGIALLRSEPATVDDVIATIRAIARLAASEAAAGLAIGRLQGQIDTPCRGLPALPVYLVVWERPALSVGGRHWINDVLALAGWRNALAEFAHGVFRIAPEAHFARRGLPRISLVRRFDDSSADRLADLLSRPGPGLGEAVQLLCQRRLALSSPVEATTGR